MTTPRAEGKGASAFECDAELKRSSFRTIAIRSMVEIQGTFRFEGSVG
ncbi:hypothetical protein [Nocardia sp. NPDC059228]